MREVHYHDWLSNPVLVKKHDDIWRMCVDFKDLNKACPKDGITRAGEIVEGRILCGFPFNCFLGSRYKRDTPNQIEEEDEEKKTAGSSQTKAFFVTRNAFGLRKLAIVKPYQRLWTGHSTDKLVEILKSALCELKKRNVLGISKSHNGVKKRSVSIKLYEGAQQNYPCSSHSEEKRGISIIFLAASKEAGVPEDNIHFHGKISASTSTCKQKAKKILPSTPNCSNNRSTNQKHTILKPKKLWFGMQSGSYSRRFGIHYRPRISVKGQVLADFILERPEEENSDVLAKEEEPLLAQWTLFTDGSSRVDGCGAGIILTNPEGIEFMYALQYQFKATNNEAEYEALIAGLRIAEKMGAQNLQVNVDSKLVANQVNGTYIAKETDMVKYLEKVKTLAKAFGEFSINQVPRKENKKADAT
ncbi:reverse transcriptase domain-containing protein [Tanacetum coccineum]|uniref:Reverse transcriptase domain-containing protein n=1 Tax=Tanacetum coccineum TaxID=301880 RepID=A0ABQ5G5B9_9ASTR